MRGALFKASISAGLAFLYGFILLRFFRYLLNQFYPFFSSHISLSLFSYTIAFFLWLSFFRFFPKHYKANLNEAKLRWPLLINTLFLLSILFFLSEEFLLYGIPVFYALLLAVQAYFYTSLLPKKMSHRPFLFGGMAVALLLGDFPKEIFLILSLGALPFLFPFSWLISGSLPVLRHRIRLLPLRLSLDFIRFLFLAMALYGVFDKFRNHFYSISFLLLFGALGQELILRYHKKKAHVRFGLLFLGPFFALLGILAHILVFPGLLALGYVFLSFWEAVYFRRAPEGYLRREHWLSGLVLLLLIFFHFLNERWAFFLTGFLVFLSLVFIFAYLYQKYRQILALLFMLSLLSWFFWGVSQYPGLIIREFWEKKTKNHIEILVHPSWYFLSNLKNILVTNLHPEGLDQKELELTDKKIYFKSISPFFLTSWLLFTKLGFEEKSVLLYLAHLGPYAKEPGKTILKNFNEKILKKSVFLIDEIPKEIWLEEKVVLSESDFYKIIGFFAENELKKQNYPRAYSYYEIFQKYYPNSEYIYEKLAEICGQMGDVICQIQNLEIFLQKNKSKNFFEKKFLLVELYFLQGNFMKAREQAMKLLQQDPKNGLLYLNWIFKTMERERDHLKWLNFYYQVKNYPVGNENEKRDKEVLLEKIEQALEANPAFHYLFEKEQKRQEHIYFPD